MRVACICGRMLVQYMYGQFNNDDISLNPNLSEVLAADPRSTAFPPGWNGLAMTPPMGWRSWNAFGNRITQSMMMEAARALTTARTGLDDNASLCDIGYCSVGVDEGWENCSGVNASAGMRQHDSAGLPLIDHKSFPDTKAMVQEIHALGLAAGWYLNGCQCGDAQQTHLLPQIEKLFDRCDW